MEMPPRAQHAYYTFAVAQAAVCTLLVEWEYDQPGDRHLWVATASSSTVESKARRVFSLITNPGLLDHPAELPRTVDLGVGVRIITGCDGLCAEPYLPVPGVRASRRAGRGASAGRRSTARTPTQSGRGLAGPPRHLCGDRRAACGAG